MTKPFLDFKSKVSNTKISHTKPHNSQMYIRVLQNTNTISLYDLITKIYKHNKPD